MCGIIGVTGIADAARLAYLGLYSLQHRGQESSGIVAVDGEGAARSHRGMGLVSDVFDEKVLHPVTEHFNIIAKREGFPIGMPAEYDYEIYQHQVPGGMISNLGHQLRQVGKESQLAQALEETDRKSVV